MFMAIAKCQNHKLQNRHKELQNNELHNQKLPIDKIAKVVKHEEPPIRCKLKIK